MLNHIMFGKLAFLYSQFIILLIIYNITYIFSYNDYNNQ
jgi:hypothetical protein